MLISKDHVRSWLPGCHCQIILADTGEAEGQILERFVAGRSRRLFRCHCAGCKPADCIYMIRNRYPGITGLGAVCVFEKQCSPVKSNGVAYALVGQQVVAFRSLRSLLATMREVEPRTAGCAG